MKHRSRSVAAAARAGAVLQPSVLSVAADIFQVDFFHLRKARIPDPSSLCLCGQMLWESLKGGSVLGQNVHF